MEVGGEMIPKEIIYKYNIGATLEELKSSLGDTPDTELKFYHTVLMQTDHIPLKIFEDYIVFMVENNVNVGNMKKFFEGVNEEYGDVLEARKLAWEEINRIESEMVKEQLSL